jgi:hypothetical protein
LHCPRPRNDQGRYVEAPGRPLGGLEGGQRIPVPAARQLQDPATVADRHRHRGLGLSGHGALAALDPWLGLFRPSLPGQHGTECPAGDAEGRLVGPAVPLGQFDRLPGGLSWARKQGRDLARPRRRPSDFGHRQACQAGELQERPPEPARQRDALLQVFVCPLEPGGPGLGAAQADQRQRTQVPAQVRLRRLQRLGCGLQPLRLLGRRLGVPALARVQQPDNAEQNLALPAPAGRHRRRRPLGQREIPLHRPRRGR